MRLLHQIPPNTYDDDLALTPRDGPQAVLGLMSDITEAALAANVYLLHPNEVESTGGRPRIAISPVRPERSLSMGPEVGEGGAVPATLTYSVAAIAALATLGTLEPAPDTADLHRVWVDGLRERLKLTWTGLAGASQAIDIVARCMAFEPSARPHPKNLREEIAEIRTMLDRPTPGPATSESSPRTASAPATPTHPAMSHPLVPYAMVTVVLASLALAIALCTFGAVVGQFADEMTAEPGAGPAPRPAATAAPVAAEPDPGMTPAQTEPGVAPASLFDRFDRAPPPPLDPLAGHPGQPEADEAVPTRSLQSPPERPHSVQRPSSTAPPAPAPAAPAPRPKAEPEERPKVAPGNDLLDPWDR